jgi:hypothetical protein
LTDAPAWRDVDVKYRLVTAVGIALTWPLIYMLNLEDSENAYLIPIAALAFFQIGEKRIRKIFNRWS